MEFKRIAVAFMAVAFLFPVKSFAETAKVGDIAWGFRTDKKLNDMTNLWEPKNVGVLDKNTGITHVTEVTKVACVIDSCFYRTEYKGTRGKKEEMHVFNTEDIAPKNSGNKKNNIGEKDVEENAKKIGVEKEKLRKALEDENEYQRLLREIQVKKAEQLRKEQLEKEKNKNSGKKEGSKIKEVYFNSNNGKYADTLEGVCSGNSKDGNLFRVRKLDSGYDFCQIYVDDQYGARPLGSANISKYKVSSQQGDCGTGSNKTFDLKKDGTFSVVCTYKHNPENESPSVASTSNSSSNTSSADSSRHNSSSVGGGASAGGGNAPGGGSSGASTAGGSTSAGNSGNSGGESGVNSNAGSSSNNSSSSNGSGTGSGSGEGNGDNEGDFKGIPKYGEPDWGNLKSDGGFGNFSPSNAFTTGGSCMADVQLDMGEFGNHTLPMSFVCQFLEKLRYVFIAMAYLYSAILVFKTVNSLKG